MKDLCVKMATVISQAIERVCSRDSITLQDAETVLNLSKSLEIMTDSVRHIDQMDEEDFYDKK